MGSILDVVRSRVRRELRLWMLRCELSAWQITQAIQASQRIASSRRFGGPKISFRAVEGLLAGKASNENTVTICGEYLAEETGLAREALWTSEHTIAAGKGFKAFARSPEKGTLVRPHVGGYSGVYTIFGTAGGPVAFALAVDHLAEENLLLVRAVLREGTRQHHSREYLEGFAVPQVDQLALYLRHARHGTHYSVLVPGADGVMNVTSTRAFLRLPMPSKALPTRLVIPAQLDGTATLDPYQPWQHYEKAGYSILSKFWKWPDADAGDLDIFRDCHHFGFQRTMDYALPDLNADFDLSSSSVEI